MKRSRWRAAIVTCAIAVALGACSNGAHNLAGGSSASSTQSPGAERAQGGIGMHLTLQSPDPRTAKREEQEMKARAKIPLKISGVVTPSCVRQGGTATIKVTVEPKAEVAYDAMYAGGYSGGKPPFGNGLGGNNAGQADARGRYTDTWVVSPKAPTGAGYVKVIAATIDGRRASADLPFAVAGVTGTC